MSFEQFSFDPRIRAGIKAVGYTTPTPIQQQAIPHVLKGHDILGIAQTGTGKTAAFVLPILERLSKSRSRKVRALVLAPTRELAEQIYQASVELGQKTGLRSVAIYGGVSKNPQIAALRQGVDVVVACPGRLLDLAGERNIDLSGIEVLVLDEADRMCDMGFLPDIRRVLKLVPAQRQTLFFSATMPEEIRELADGILTQPVTVQIGSIAPAKTVGHALYPIAQNQKKDLLLTTLETTATGRVLIFARTKYRARSLAHDLEKAKYRVAALQGNMSQNARQKALDGFREGRYDILVATDIAARGIDVPDIAYVINFDMPDSVEAYTHRIGRTGRVDRSGEALSFVAQGDEPMVSAIEKTLGKRIERRQPAGFEMREVAPMSEAPRPLAERGRSWSGGARERGVSRTLGRRR